MKRTIRAIAAIALVSLLGACSAGEPVSRIGAAAGGKSKAVRVNTFDFESDGQGWVLTEGQVDRTSNAGRSWSDKTPSDSRGKGFARGMVAASFPSADTAWVARRDASTPMKAAVTVTNDGGSKWTTRTVKLDFGDEAPGDGVHLFTLDEKHGWLIAKAQSGSARSAGVMYRTGDGGSTWSKSEVPIGDAVQFTSATTGWLTGGPASNQLFDTLDGGSTWDAVTSLPLLSGDLSLTTIAEPLFANSEEGVVPVQIRNSDTDPGSKLYFDVTHDGGRTWTTAGDPVETALDGDIFSADLARVSVVDADTWFLFADRLYQTTDGGKTWSPVTSDRDDLSHTTSSEFVSATDGWAYLENTDCAQVKSECTTQGELIRTTDGGKTWTVASPPA